MTEVRAKKALGQHFLTDLNIARKICDALSGGAIRLHPAARGPEFRMRRGNGRPGPAASSMPYLCRGDRGGCPGRRHGCGGV